MRRSASVAKAASISRSVAALTKRSSIPIARAAACKAWTWVSACIVGISQHGDDGNPGHELVQNLQPLRIEQHGNLSNAGDVAARPIEARDQPQRDRVTADREDDRQRRCCPFGSEGSGGTAG